MLSNLSLTDRNTRGAMSTFELSLYGALSSPELPGLLRKLCRLTGDLIQGHNYAEQDLVYVPLGNVLSISCHT